MSQPASSVQADRSTIGALAAFLATGAAASLGLFPVLIMQETVGTDGIIGWALGVVLAGIVAGLTTKPVLHQMRMVAVVVGGIVLPVALMAVGNASMGAVLLGVGLVASAFVMPLVEWALGLSESTGTTQKTSMFQFSSGREVSNPIPMSLVLGVLIFAWPGDLLTAGWVAAPFFGFLLMLASLGGMFNRVRETSSGLVAVHPKFMAQWFFAGLLATILCAALGFVLPVSMGNINGVADRKLGGPVSQGPYATERRDVNNTQPRPDQRYNPNGLGDKQFQKDLPAPNSNTNKPTPEDMKTKLYELLGLFILAAIALWLLKKYNKQVLAFLRWLGALIAKPFINAYRRIVEGSRKKKHDAAVRAILAQIEDPFSDPPAGMTSEDLRPMYDKLVADLSLLGARPKADESAIAFVRRVATVYTVDKESLYYLGQVMTEATFAPRPVNDTKLTNARDRFLKIRKQVHGSITPQQLAEKQEAYRWSFAESKLPEEAEKTA